MYPALLHPVVENPSGNLKHVPYFKAIKEGKGTQEGCANYKSTMDTVNYCMYGGSLCKPTDLFHNISVEVRWDRWDAL